MPSTATLFHSTDAARETLHKRITPTDEQFEDQKDRWNDLAVFLKARLKADTGLATRTWLQGSYKFDTQIRPAMVGAQFDIDLGFYFEWTGKPEDGDHSAEQLKAFVQAALVTYQADKRNDATSVEEPKERCCRITFNPDFHIDVPAYHLDDARDARALATETKGWEDSDPKAIYKWFKERYEDAPSRARLRRQVRYLKMWAALNFDDSSRPSSILLTVLAAEAVAGVDSAATDDDQLLEHIAVVIYERLSADTTVTNPVNAAEDLNRLGKAANLAFVERLNELVGIAQRARLAADIGTAAEIWAEAFGQFFPMPEDNEDLATVQKAENAIALYRFDPLVRVQAVPRGNKHKRWEGMNGLPPIPKDCDITFTLTNASQLPLGATLRWTVRNRGDEAVRLNDLGHRAGTGLSITEHSAYNGDHAMDLAVFLGDQVIGRRRILIKVRGVAMPARNRPRRRYFG